MTTTDPTTGPSPARIYLESLSRGSQDGMGQALEMIAEMLSDGDHDAESFPWWEVRFKDTAAVRTALGKRYKPATVNKILSALRGVLKQAWRLGYVDADTYRRAVDVENLRSRNLLGGRRLDPAELKALFTACGDDRSPAGRRDAALLAVFYGGGLRRAEVTGLDLDDFDLDACSLTIRNGKRRKQRTVYLTVAACRLVTDWVRARSDDPGPLFCPVARNGEVRVSRLRGESIAYILRCRQEQAEIEPFSAHDLRRSFISDLLTAGTDLLTVQQLAGHADPSTTARYDRRGEAVKKQAAQALTIPTELKA